VVQGLVRQQSTQHLLASGSALELEASAAIEVNIDKPGSFLNSITLTSRGIIPVAILLTVAFNAPKVPKVVDRTSLTPGRTGNNEERLAFCTKSAEDVKSDGLLSGLPLLCLVDRLPDR
jgi:hypothetical protein